MPHWTDLLDPNGPDGAYLPWKKVEPRVGISRTTAWRLQNTGDFPKPYVVSPGRVAYRESEVEAWKASRGHRTAADFSPRITLATTVDTVPLHSTPAEPSSWSPPTPVQSADIVVPQSAPGAPESSSRASRRGSRVRGDRSDRDQMKFEF